MTKTRKQQFAIVKAAAGRDFASGRPGSNGDLSSSKE